MKSQEQALTTANETNVFLKTQITDIKTSSEQTQDNHFKCVVVKEQEYQQEMKIKEKEIKSLTSKLEKTKKKKARQMMQDLKAEHEQTIATLRLQLEGEKQSLAGALDLLQEKYRKTKAAVKQFGETEKRNLSLGNDKQRLQRQTKETEQKVLALQEQLEREAKDAKGRLAWNAECLEGKHRRELCDLKKGLAREKEEFTQCIKSRLGALFGISEFDLDERSLEQLFDRLRKDLEKLKFFQFDAIKI
jgi:chromosome segregation ATPase